MPEAGGQEIGAEILLPRVDKMAKSHVVTQSHEDRGNIMGRANTNPIMDTRLYQVEFAEGKVTELVANVIAESMYAQFNADGNEYLLLGVFVNYHKDNRVISLTD